jgi:hypothetical protein
MMPQTAYAIGVLTSIVCVFLLTRSYLVQRTPLLLWCTLCFAGLAVNNVLLFTDLFIVPELSLELWRNLTALVSLCLMLMGLIWEEA